ncbi:MAG: helix-turn-helix transcriptional regulator [Fluviicola sp.]
MEIKLLMMAIEGLSKRVDDIMRENQSLKNEVKELRRQIDMRPSESVAHTQVESKQEDELLTLKSAIALLKISRSGFIRMVNEGTFKPIKFNLRTLRYSKHDLMNFIKHREN